MEANWEKSKRKSGIPLFLMKRVGVVGIPVPLKIHRTYTYFGKSYVCLGACPGPDFYPILPDFYPICRAGSDLALYWICLEEGDPEPARADFT